ncbi:grasp-with-spasm system SPASM domain peptide maturase [Olivibacter sp. XZL3]|uniref:grasp-with-spasm system SPASM domain peptide maturase n=1 Tax=Olivibacter sp. XZL3 TaxID=1735116 RepID=UPI0010669330|nr:grasp-with-spasm system SPASM domain peptide maturase [Olivibacter sp. XZL3]
MIERSSYFNLFANCIPVKGARRSIICDLQNGVFELIPNSLVDILEEYRSKNFGNILDSFEENSHDTIYEYFYFMVKKGFGYFSKQLDLGFIDLELDFDTPEKISNCIIDIDSFSNHDFGKIALELDQLDCKALQIRSYADLSPQDLLKILEEFKLSGLRDIQPIVKYNKSFHRKQIVSILNKHQRISQITFHSAPKRYSYKEVLDSIWVVFTDKNITSADECGCISSSYFVINLPMFSESLNFNSCLNKKISIDAGGNIKNCPTMKRSYGNISETSMLEAYADKDFKSMWNINKDKIEVCKDCEFRYICTDCRAFLEAGKLYSKPIKCNYNPYTAVWE